MHNQLIFGLFLLIGLGSAQAAENGALLSHKAQYQLHTKEQLLDGVVEAVNRATISSEVSGRVTAIKVDVDDFVEKNQIIAYVRDKEYKAGLSKANAALQSARAEAKDARLDFDRKKDLANQGLISVAMLDQAQARLNAAEANVNAAEAQVTEANEQVGNTAIRAPYSGIVTERLIEVGEMASPGKPIMSGLAMNKLRVNVQVPQAFINAVRQHKKASIILPDGRRIDAAKLTIYPIADAAHHTFRVRLDLPENTEQIFPGMLVKASFTVAEEQALLVPAQAAFHRSEVSAIYVIAADGKISMRQVRLGNRKNDLIEILSGLRAGETIALDPVQAGVQLKSQAGGK
ncbi:MAG: efflux RND transporter periplasmic adaptor subunit [Gammaproteobacteria bacterium]|nr:efflux RND transporter periplasmic adaptor subunit [Gammaproteobacteria bacterium]